MAGVENWTSHFGIAHPPFAKSIPPASSSSAPPTKRPSPASATACPRWPWARSPATSGQARASPCGRPWPPWTGHATRWCTSPTRCSAPGAVCEHRVRPGGGPRFHKAEVMAQAATLLAAEEASATAGSWWPSTRLISFPGPARGAPAHGQCRDGCGVSLRLVLLGQPMLSRQLRSRGLRCARSRIAVRYQIAGMDLSESLAYLRHHLSLAGGQIPSSRRRGGSPAPLRQRLPRALNNAATAALMAQRPRAKPWSTMPVPGVPSQSSP